MTTPILVTGMPRSGTTWLARLLAAAPGTALTGREPMNPRGRQYGLGGTLAAWARLEAPTNRQRRILRASYSGLNPFVYSRYGHRQWAAPLPWTRIIVKDPFAMLSLPAVRESTGATAVLLFRHPGAALTSYRRMGWSADVDELVPIIESLRSRYGDIDGVTSRPASDDDVSVMAWFWSALYGIALRDAERLENGVVVLAHEDIAAGGVTFGKLLTDRLELRWSDAIAQQLNPGGASRAVDATALHNLNRDPTSVAHEWETRLQPGERERLEEATDIVRAALQRRAFRPEN